MNIVVCVGSSEEICFPCIIYIYIYVFLARRILRICCDPATAQSSCNELIEYLVHRGHGRRRTQLEFQLAIDANRVQKQQIRNIDIEVYFIVHYHPGLPDIKGTLRKFLRIVYTVERMTMVLFRPPVVLFLQPKFFSQQLCRA